MNSPSRPAWAIMMSPRNTDARSRGRCWQAAMMPSVKMTVVSMTSQIEMPSTPTSHDTPAAGIQSRWSTCDSTAAWSSNSDSTTIDTARVRNDATSATPRARRRSVAGSSIRTTDATSGTRMRMLTQGIRTPPPRRAPG